MAKKAVSQQNGDTQAKRKRNNEVETEESDEERPAFGCYHQPFWLGMTMSEALAFYKDRLEYAARRSGSEGVRIMRGMLGERDLFFLLVFILKRKDMINPWLYARCREFQRNPNGNLDLWAREHYKSTIITYGGTFLDIITNPEVTLAIFSHTRGIAKTFLRQIKQEMENNEVLKETWPHIFWADPVAQAPKWSEDDGIIVKRTTNPKEATLEAWGLVDGQPTSRHFLGRIYDDVVTRESVTTPEQIKKTTEAWELSDNLGAHGGFERYIGTRYHLFDSYRTMIDRKVVNVRVHAATHDATEQGDPVFLTREQLARKRAVQGPYTFSSQMLQNPVADSTMGFRQQWLRFREISYTQAMDSLFRVLLVDPAGSKKRKSNDYTSMWVMGYSATGRWYVLDGVRDRMNLTERTAAVMALHRRWKPQRVGYEEYGMQADIEHIQHMQEMELYDFPIIALGGNQMTKTQKIERLVPYYEQGRILLPPTLSYREGSYSKSGTFGKSVDLIKVFLEEEYQAFPVLNHDDMLDNMSRCLDPLLMVETPIIHKEVTARDFGVAQGLAPRTGGGNDDASWMTG
jgi:phage terminase large subunit-like protein